VGLRRHSLGGGADNLFFCGYACVIVPFFGCCYGLSAFLYEGFVYSVVSWSSS
jgi:hypothetical protein